jgi:hypothetical protein
MEQQFLFPRQFDQSRWIFRFDVDRALYTVQYTIHGWAGRDGEPIAAEQGVEGALEGWSERFYYGSRTLWGYLETQCKTEGPGPGRED